MSEQKSIHAALLDFNKEFEAVSFDSANPVFHSKYSSLNEVVTTVRPILAKHGLFLMQRVSSDGEAISVCTEICSQNGDCLKSDLLSVDLTDYAGKNKVQYLGSLITYLKRYSLTAFLAITSQDDDDDANACEKPTQLLSDEERRELFNAGAQESVRSVLASFGYTTTKNVKKSDLPRILETLAELQNR